MPDSGRAISDFIAHMRVLHDEAEARRYAENYISIHHGAFPIVEGDTAHFVYHAHPDMVVGISGEWNGMDLRRAVMEPIGGGLVHFQQAFEDDARLDYFFAEVHAQHAQEILSNPDAYKHVQVHTVLDPLNTRFGASGFGPKSELAMPGYQRPSITLERSDVRKGVVQQKTIYSHVLQQKRSYTVYLPAGYTAEQESYPSVYFHDGNDYLTIGCAPIILDNLIHDGALSPLVAVFVPPHQREDEYNCNDDYVRFFCDELVPEVQRQYHLSTDPRKCCVLGPSMGGIIALYMGYQRPDTFGLIGAQSSVVMSLNGLEKFDARKDFAVEPPLPSRLYLVIGSYESCFRTDSEGYCQDLLTPVQELHAVLERCGYSCRYREDHQGHSWGLWRDSLADALTYLYS